MDQEAMDRWDALAAKKSLTPEEHFEKLLIEYSRDSSAFDEGYAEAGASIFYGPGPYDARPEDLDQHGIDWSGWRGQLARQSKRLDEVAAVVAARKTMETK